MRRLIVRARSLVGAIAVAVGLSSCTSPPAEPSEQPSPGSPSTASPVPAAFRFHVTHRGVVRVGELSRRDRRIAARATAAVRSVITDLYVSSFLDPAAWGSGDYGDVLALFGRGAQDEARRRLSVLTAGVDAGDRFDQIVARPATLGLQLMTDRGGATILISATARFRAVARGEDEARSLRSDGRFVLERIDGRWRIVGFDVTRSDRPRGAP